MSQKKLAIAVAICLVIGAAAIGSLAYQARRALVISHIAACGRWATAWVEQYVRENDGRWPRSWDDLQACEPKHLPSHFDVSTVDRTIRTRIVVDFDADPADLATQTVDEFIAIRSLVDYGVDHREYWHVESLLKTLGEFLTQAPRPLPATN